MTLLCDAVFGCVYISAIYSVTIYRTAILIELFFVFCLFQLHFLPPNI